MTRLPPLEGDGEAEGLKDLFAEIRLVLELAEVPEMLRMVAHSPGAVKGLWSFMQAALFSDQGTSNVSQTTKMLVALAASSSANAGHLRDLMRKRLEEFGIGDAMLNDLVEKGETLRLPNHTQQILLFARRAALDPAMLQDDDFEALRKAGLSDADIAELVAFSSLISSLIAVTRALGLTEDPRRSDQESEEE